MKLLTYLFSITVLVLIWSCTDDPYTPEPEAENVFKIDAKTTKIKATFNIGTPYLLKVNLNNTFNDYDSVTVTAKFKYSTQKQIKFYDDGGLNSSSHDLVAKNNIWTAYYLPTHADSAYRDSMIVTANLYQNNKVTTSVLYSLAFVKVAKPAVIDSITVLKNGKIFESGFTKFRFCIFAHDPDNPVNNNITLYEDTLKAFLELFDSTGLSKRCDTIVNYRYQKDSLKFNHWLSASYAAGIATGSAYKIKCYVDDSYDGTDAATVCFDSIRIVNKAPVISNFQCPDTVFIPKDNKHTDYSVFLTVEDDQGYTEKNDIDSVRLIVTSLDTKNSWQYKLYNNGTAGDVTPNDKIYSLRFISDKSEPGRFNLKLTAFDKVPHMSNVIEKNILYFKRTSKTNFKGKK